MYVQCLTMHVKTLSLFMYQRMHCKHFLHEYFSTCASMAARKNSRILNNLLTPCKVMKKIVRLYSKHSSQKSFNFLLPRQADVSEVKIL